jgi:hypothetical protein
MLFDVYPLNSALWSTILPLFPAFTRQHMHTMLQLPCACHAEYYCCHPHPQTGAHNVFTA